MRIHLGAHKAFVAGKAAATDLDWNSDMFRAGLRDRRQLRVETHPPRRARQVQRDRSREALRYFDIGEHVVMQELAEIEHAHAAGRHVLQALRTGARVGKDRPASAFARLDQGDYRFFGLAIGFCGKSFRIERLAAAQARLP